MAIGVGEAEVDDFHIVAIMGNHDIRGLQVAVHHLLRMDVGDALCKFVQDALPLLLRGVFVEVGCQSASVDPLGDDAAGSASFGQRHVLDARCLHHGTVLQGDGNLKLLAKHLLVGGVGGIDGLEAFQQIPSSVTLGLVKVASTGGWQCHDFGEFTVDAFVVGGDIT